MWATRLGSGRITADLHCTACLAEGQTLSQINCPSLCVCVCVSTCSCACIALCSVCVSVCVCLPACLPCVCRAQNRHWKLPGHHRQPQTYLGWVRPDPTAKSHQHQIDQINMTLAAELGKRMPSGCACNKCDYNSTVLFNLLLELQLRHH